MSKPSSPLIDVYGYKFDRTTGELFDSDGVTQPYTFDYEPGFNPMQFASESTATAIKELVSSLCLGKVEIQILQTATGPMTVAQRMIRVVSGENSIEMNAGLIASSIIRSGKMMALKMIAIEMNRAGIATKH